MMDVSHARNIVSYDVTWTYWQPYSISLSIYIPSQFPASANTAYHPEVVDYGSCWYVTLFLPAKGAWWPSCRKWAGLEKETGMVISLGLMVVTRLPLFPMSHSKMTWHLRTLATRLLTWLWCAGVLIGPNYIPFFILLLSFQPYQASLYSHSHCWYKIG